MTIRDHTWRTTPGVYDGVGYVVVNRKVKTATGVDAGDRVRVAMAVDTKPRTVDVPSDLSEAFAQDEAAKAAFDALSFTHKREYVEWIEEAKRPETRARRIAGTRRAGQEGRDRALMAPLRGALAASVTPLRDAGGKLDDDAFGPLVDFFVASGLDGIMALGTSGEGILLSSEERRRATDLFLQAADRRLLVAVHCGAQTTAETVALSVHAAEVGADAVVVIGPPYFRLDEQAQLAHFQAAATACAPLPFYVYEFASTSGYPVAPSVLQRLRETAPNATGLKVSDTPWDAFSRLPAPGLRRLRRSGGAHPAGDGRRRARSGLGARVGVPRGGRGGRSRTRPSRALRASRSSGSRSSASRARRRSSGSSDGAASPCGRTCARRCAASPSRSATRSTCGTSRCSRPSSRRPPSRLRESSRSTASRDDDGPNDVRSSGPR